VALQAALDAPVAAPAAPALRFEELYDAHVDAVWRTLSRLGIEPMHLDDAAQEVFVTAWKKRDSFEHRSTAKTWLTGIAIRVAAHYRRSAARRGGSTPLNEELPSSSPAPDASVERHERLQLLQTVLSKLSDELRETFVMMEMEGFSAPETSALLGVGVNTLYSRVRLARAAFNAAVAELEQKERAR
jgi:RNA polymerase sigma-70 factor (ECF subfamily)